MQLSISSLKKKFSQQKTNALAAVSAVGLGGFSTSALAIPTMMAPLTTLICAVTGNSSIVMFSGAAALIAFLVLFLTGEGKGHIGTLLKIAIGLAALLFFPGIFNLVFGTNILNCPAVGQKF